MRRLLLIASVAVLGTPCVAAAQAVGQPPASNGVVAAPAAPTYGVESAFTSGGLEARETRISNRIRDGENTGILSRDQANRDFQTLDRVRLYQFQHAQPNGYIPDKERAQVSKGLDNLDATISSQPK
jgi:hypothetical protein